ncbi:Pyruvate ferredoxin oxidoreductase alpha subunit [Geoglobus ahangari]|uniref:Pyruvate ferredoxin oxidoreductase alpha subunit n=1 Tax=Geoglobus ahangari TaxID=113653 RepID=A0A0F7IBX7_9EURY|nr:pyruvate ferredoxin oxidoreductase [Geoglobus ahangari]AKG90708.1 Pyruvate ferredoxin oxidoreductase alpha subunit [Geoglobus ahangari]
MQQSVRDRGNKDGEGEVKLLTGNYAVAEAVKIAKPEIIAAYPITPQTPVVEKLSEMIERGELNAKMINVESEHSAMAVVFGAIAGGSRAFTATSSHGLAYMYEMCWWVAGSRLPLVMAVPTRSIGAPWNIHADHSDVMLLRDAGWIIAMAENAQEAFDLTLQGFMVSEEVNIPYAIGYDAFQVSHAVEPVVVRDVEIPERRQAYSVTPDTVIGLNAVTTTARHYARKDLMVDLENSRKVIERVGREYPEEYGFYEEYRTDGADYVVVLTGAWAGDAKEAVDQLRSEGVRVGLVKLRYIRPFPYEDLRKMDGEFMVIDRASSGNRGILGIEVSSVRDVAANVIAGLGGIELTQDDFYGLIKRFAEGRLSGVVWYP